MIDILDIYHFIMILILAVCRCLWRRVWEPSCTSCLLWAKQRRLVGVTVLQQSLCAILLLLVLSCKSQRAVENREKWRKLVAKSSVLPQRPSRLRDWWWWWWVLQRRHQRTLLFSIKKQQHKNNKDVKEKKRGGEWYRSLLPECISPFLEVNQISWPPKSSRDQRGSQKNPIL